MNHFPRLEAQLLVALYLIYVDSGNQVRLDCVYTSRVFLVISSHSMILDVYVTGRRYFKVACGRYRV